MECALTSCNQKEKITPRVLPGKNRVQLSKLYFSLPVQSCNSSIYSRSAYLTTWWRFANYQSVGLFGVFLKSSVLVDQIKSNPPQQVLTCLRKPAVNRKEILRGLTELMIPWQALRNSLLDLFIFSDIVGQMQKGSTFHQLGINSKFGWVVCFCKLPKQIKIQG